MGLLDKANAEKDKYIDILDFVNFIAFTQNEEYVNVLAFLRNNYFDEIASTYTIEPFSYRVHEHDYQSDALNAFLTERSQDFNFDILIKPLYGKNRKVSENFYLKIEQVANFDFIKELNIDFFDKKITKQINDELKELQQKEWDREKQPYKSGWGINSYFKQPHLSTKEIASLLSTISLNSVEKNEHTPHYAENFKEFIAFELYIENAIEKGDLSLNFNFTIDNDRKLQSFLFNDGYVIKGYNDYLEIEPAKPFSQNTNQTDQINTLKLEIESLKSAYELLKQGYHFLELSNKALIEQAGTPAEPTNSIDLINLKKTVIATHNNLLAKAVKSLDCDKVLTKNDIARFISPYMKEMAITIGGKPVELSTIEKDHLKGITFTEGSPTKANKEKNRIPLIFDRTQLTNTEKE